MRESDDIRRERGFINIRYGPLVHGTSRGKVLAKARQLWGEEFAIGWLDGGKPLLEGTARPKSPSPGRWYACGTRRGAWPSNPLERPDEVTV